MVRLIPTSERFLRNRVSFQRREKLRYKFRFNSPWLGDQEGALVSKTLWKEDFFTRQDLHVFDLLGDNVDGV
jgi:hypothetical protein